MESHQKYFPTFDNKNEVTNEFLIVANKKDQKGLIKIDIENKDIVFVQIAGLVARRILCYTSAGDKLGKGHRYGYIRFGSKVDIYLPLDAKITVKIGDTVMSANDVIATL